jgi:hypothetical protein
MNRGRNNGSYFPGTANDFAPLLSANEYLTWPVV